MVACIDPRLLKVDNLDVPLPPVQPAGWRADLDALFARYERSPVLEPEDSRLEPLFGGLTTLSYFGADAKPRVWDQQIPANGAALGDPLQQVCAEPFDHKSSTRVFDTIGRPAFAPVWLPLRRTGGAPTAEVTCDEHGRPRGPDAASHFCSFGRLALQKEARPLIVVVHGLFDSGAQDYVQRMAAVLWELGYSVLLPDLRDHGDTLRAAPDVATTLGTLEGPDLLAWARSVRGGCGSRMRGLGMAGVSGGGLAAIRALTLDRESLFDAGVVAVSPLLDADAAIRDLADTDPCVASRAIELTWVDDLLVGGATGAALFAGAALVQGLTGERVGLETAAVGGIGVGAGLLTALGLDAFLDGGSKACVAENAIAVIVQDVLKVRWRTLRDLPGALSPAGRRIDPSKVTLDDYVRERASYGATRMGVTLRRFEAAGLARELRASLAMPNRRHARLLVIGAEDDPMTRIAALRAFSDHTHGITQAYVRTVTHGGHGAVWIVQPTVMRAVFQRFFAEYSGASVP